MFKQSTWLKKILLIEDSDALSLKLGSKVHLQLRLIMKQVTNESKRDKLKDYYNRINRKI